MRALPKVSVVGGPGSGKSTVAALLAAKFDVPHIELDALWWDQGWKPVPLSTFQRRVRSATKGRGWVADGFYLDEATRALVWPAANVIVWLDLPRRVCVQRALRRSATRVVRRTELWGTNRQSAGVLAPLSVFRFIRRWPTYPAAIEHAVTSDPLDGKTVVRLRDDRAVAEWLADWDAPITTT